MAQAALVKIIVTSKESGLVQLMQKRDDFPIHHPFSSYLIADLADGNPPTV